MEVVPPRARGGRSTRWNITNMSASIAGTPATVVRVAVGQMRRYQAMARSGSTEFSRT